MGNNFLGNGGTELNTTSNLYDLHYRNYDPTLGRMNQVDPMATKYASLTPYNYAFNDPVYYNDVSGADPTNDPGWLKIEASRNEDLQRQYYNTHGVMGDDDMYGNLFPKAGIMGYDYSIQTPDQAWEQHLSKIFQSDIEFLDFEIKKRVLSTGKFDAYGRSWVKYGSATIVAKSRSQFQIQDRQQQIKRSFGERADISLYRKRGESVGWKTLLIEYKTGLGPERSVFYQDHPVVQDMINSFVVRQAKKKFERGGRRAMDFVDIEFEWWDVPGAGYNMTEQFIGSARVSITPTKDGRIKYQLDNTTDRNSGSIDKDTKSIPRDSNHLTPNGTIYQRLIWWEN